MTNDQAPMTNAAVKVPGSLMPVHSPLAIRHSPFTIRHSPARRGVTLLEVLFAIMVASVGLLGAIAVFPVALAQARKGRQADATAVGADAAVGIFDTQFMRRPDRWLRWDSTNMPPQTQFLPLNFNQAGSPFFGRAFCIDPIGFSHHSLIEDPNGNYANLWSWFPAVQETNPTPNAVPNSSRMVRLTLHNNNPNFLVNPTYQMSYLQADKVFRIEDELMFERPADNSLPAAQLFTKMLDANGNKQPGRRQEEGRLTWFATLVPKLDRLNSQLGEEYVLSVAVCLNRTGEATHVPDPNLNDHPFNEWTAKILSTNYHGAGIGGGEVTITTNDSANNPFANGAANNLSHQDQLNAIKTGSWVLLGTRAAWRTTPQVIQVFHWYRVSDADEGARQNPNNTTRYDRDVTLVGPDWPADITGDGNNDECDVIIMPHVVHVYERTIRIDTGALQ